MQPRLSYIVCASPRSGSSLVCKALGATGVAGRPDEYFRPLLLEEILLTRKLRIRSEAEFLQRVKDISTTPNGVFGTKLHPFYTDYFLSKVEAHYGKVFGSLRTGLEAEFPNLCYIHITRRDKIAQAVSYYRALMTNEWWRWSNNQVPSRDALIPFDQFGIKKCLQLITAMDTYWDKYFQTHSLTPLYLTYEDLESNYQETLKKVLEFLELSSSIPPAETIKMADDRSRKWAQEFSELERVEPFEMLEKLPSWAPF